jgi:hypothetical protein
MSRQHQTPSLTVFLQPELSVLAELAKIVQQEVVSRYTSLRTVTTAIV